MKLITLNRKLDNVKQVAIVTKNMKGEKCYLCTDSNVYTPAQLLEKFDIID
jgi:hypothetical protein